MLAYFLTHSPFNTMPLLHNPLSISLYLGYSVTDAQVLPLLDDFTASQVDAILDNLAAIDTALAAGRLDSMATKVDTLSVDYLTHIGILKDEGSRLLVELSTILGIPIKTNKYAPKGVGSGSRTRALQVVSYW